ncbi:MAG: glycyl-radical enzyme activating protein [Clostridia bacterium]|nr:glycyl-radical enzyme activating protein [Clostridia bacterium]
MSVVSGTVFDIQRFSLHDGPGVRTTVFLKGCPLRCRWCHNPEGLSPYPQISYDPSRCIGCMECAGVCSCHRSQGSFHVFDRTLCRSCGRCATVCPSHALEPAGREMTVDEVMKTVLADKRYYKADGGMTVSGGEPLFQPEFTEALLSAARAQGINTAVETCGYADGETFIKIASLAHILLFDFKLDGEAEHIKYTGVSNRIIKENLCTAADMDIPIILRCPLVPGVNDTEKHIESIAETANSLKSVREIHIEPYHTLGLSKAELFGMKSSFAASPVTVPDAEKICEKLRKLTHKKVKVSK